jgi:sulfotransferase family protein
LLQSILSAHPQIHAIRDELWAFCYGPAAGLPGRRPVRITRLYKYLGHDRGPRSAQRWCEKSPANVYYFHDAIRFFRGRVRLIQIVRDGRDVVTSMHPGNAARPWVPISRWVDSVQAGLPFREHDLAVTIRYEDLVQEYDATIRTVLEFLDEDYVPELGDWHRHATVRMSNNLMSGVVEGMHTASVRKFEAPGFAHQALVDEIGKNVQAKHLMEAYGYV